MNNIAIIPARGGSKRIPKKNIRNFLGKPIIVYSIEAAFASGIFSEVMVSTDDDEIAKLAISHGASVPFLRSSKNSDDYATTSDVLTEVLLYYQSINKKYDYACCIYPTAVLMEITILVEAYHLALTDKYDLILPIVPYSFPVLRSFIKDSDEKIKYAYPQYINSRSQDLPPHYYDAGQFLFFKIIPYLERGKLTGDSIFGIELNPMQVQDIDNEEDWLIAELKYNIQKKLK